ncbi:MAG: hypothetical protein ACD_8C00124G0013 [uncultured bacterium]|nr:MAG: hypothetical protein ACD_8C00124G0013 [uncultured bacterium]
MKNNKLQKNIPEGWEEVELQDFADLIMGQSPSSASYNQNGEGLPFLQGNADFIKGNKYPRVRQWTTAPTKISENGSILFSVRAPVGDVFLNNTKACIGRGLASFNIKKGNSQEFLYYCLQNLKDEFNKLSQGSTFTAINSDSLRKIKTVKPKSLEEQNKIAGILGGADAEIERVDEVIKKTEELKKGLMQELFTKGIGHTKFKKTKLGMIPYEWDIVGLSNIIQIKHGYAFKGVYFTDVKTSYILLTPGNFKIGGGFNDSKFKYYLGGKGELPREYILDAGQMLLTMTDLSKAGDTLGYPALAPNSPENTFLHNQRLGKVSFLNEQIYKEFLYWRLRASDYRDMILSTAAGTTVRHTSPQKIGRFIFAMPSVAEQIKIAEILSNIDEKISINKQIKEKLTELKKGLMRDLLSGKVRVSS